MLTQDMSKWRYTPDPEDAEMAGKCPASDCRDNNWVHGQLRNYRKRWALRLVPWPEMMRKLHHWGGDYDYFVKTPGAWYELSPGKWVSAAGLGNYIAGYGAGGGPPLSATHYALTLTEMAGGYYNATRDTTGRFGDRHRDTFLIEKGFKDGLRDRLLFRPLLVVPFEVPVPGLSGW
jgi:hypothetical protein